MADSFFERNLYNLGIKVTKMGIFHGSKNSNVVSLTSCPIDAVVKFSRKFTPLECMVSFFQTRIYTSSRTASIEGWMALSSLQKVVVGKNVTYFGKETEKCSRHHNHEEERRGCLCLPASPECLMSLQT